MQRVRASRSGCQGFVPPCFYMLYLDNLKKSAWREVIRTDKPNNAPPLAELIDEYNTYKRTALEYENKARMCMAAILFALTGESEEPEKALHIIQRLRIL